MRIQKILLWSISGVLLLSTACSAGPPASALSGAGSPSSVAVSAYESGHLYRSRLGYTFQYPASWESCAAIAVQNEGDADTFLCEKDEHAPLLVIGRAPLASWDAGEIRAPADYTLLPLAQTDTYCYYAQIADKAPPGIHDPDLYNSLLLPQSEVSSRFSLDA